MLQFSAALLSRALGPLIALFSSPCGRHSNVAGRRRRRSTRVRRHAPVPAPAQLPAPRLAPPSETVPAEAVALVRPYYAAHELLRASANPASANPVPAPSHHATRVPAPPVPAPRSAEPGPDEVQRAFDRVQERAAALLQQWRDDPGGDLLGEPAPRFGAVRPTSPARYAEWDELASLTRAWIEQRRLGVPA
ncbi:MULTISPECIES: hypothetical protein [Nocardiopsis]|uniref:Uncharacterized protein n=1 Tax=Nocardiopsis sinuspersici TaxID=501010 RepID=A0A1V3C3U1_9ACTN|nr:MULTISPECIES: hypothetical protein [Nocardiopsis]OOC55461.1 hypothetical protein NOSIN_17925 [Nocardiopsis sinuspersici]